MSFERSTESMSPIAIDDYMWLEERLSGDYHSGKFGLGNFNSSGPVGRTW